VGRSKRKVECVALGIGLWVWVPGRRVMLAGEAGMCRVVFLFLFCIFGV